MPARLLHISDLHVGTLEETALQRALGDLVQRLNPDLVVMSGDLTHRCRPEQHQAAADFLRGLERPLHVIPGNHDIPTLSLGRFTRTFEEFCRHWRETEPVYRSDEFFVVGLNSVRAFRYQSGGVRDAQLRWAAEQLAQAPESALRVVTLHHHLLSAPWRSVVKRPVSRRTHVLARLVDAGAELILAGHVHQAAVAERREFEVARGGERGVTVVLAPGLGQPRPNRRGEARGLHVFDVETDSLRVFSFVWQDDAWALIGDRRLPRGRSPLAETPAWS